jgi:RNA polymerase sigma-70 factor, ECF subfamily
MITVAEISKAAGVDGTAERARVTPELIEQRTSMPEENIARTFEDAVLPHLDAAYNLARWLVRNTHDAEDVVQEAYLRALKFFGGYQGGDARAWLLKIVRNTSYSFLKRNRPAGLAEEFDERVHTAATEQPGAEAALLQSADSRMLREALDELPVNFREVLVLRELEDLSYRQIAEVTGLPVGTVMSSLSRARERLRQSFAVLAETTCRGKKRGSLRNLGRSGNFLSNSESGYK